MSTRLGSKFFTSTSSTSKLQHGAVYLALVLAAGVVLEDISKNYAARRASFFPELFNYVLDADNELRFRSLFTVVTLTDDKITASPRGIFRELQMLPFGHQGVKPHRIEILNQIPSPVPTEITVTGKDQVAALLRAIDGVFYDAKNQVYREETYFNELSEISDRMDFTRSLTFQCLLFSIIYCAFGILGFIPKVGTYLNIKGAVRLKVFVISGLFAAGIWFVGTAYRSEVTNYDLRVFGYYITLTLDSKSDR